MLMSSPWSRLRAVVSRPVFWVFGHDLACALRPEQLKIHGPTVGHVPTVQIRGPFIQFGRPSGPLWGQVSMYPDIQAHLSSLQGPPTKYAPPTAFLQHNMICRMHLTDKIGFTKHISPTKCVLPNTWLQQNMVRRIHSSDKICSVNYISPTK